jgi:hypothetical protein
MGFADLLDHEVYINRKVGTGTEDEYGQPVTTPQTSHHFAAAIQPKTANEIALASQAGTPLGNFTIFMLPRVVDPAEAIIHDTNLCPKEDGVDFADCRFEIVGILNETGRGHHLALDVRLVGSPGGVEGS